jgi:4-amino-4-deoxy-L-arabinose transferase-like glycosyltransferase
MPTADSEATSTSKNTLWTYVFFAGVGAIAIALRLPELSTKGLWLDEAYSVLAARLPFMEMLERLSSDATPPLYYVLLAPWLHLFGAGAAAARSLSIVFSIGSIAMTGLVSVRFFSPRIATISTLLMAFTPMHIYYAQEARMYSLLALLGTALVFATLEFYTKRTKRSLILAAVFSVLMLLTHNIAAWFVIGVNAAFLSVCNDRKLLLRWLMAQAIAAVCYLPWLMIALEHLHEQGDVLAWFSGYWNAKSLVGHFMTSIGTFALGDFPPYLAISSPLSTAPFLRSGALLLVCFGLFRWRHSDSARFVAVALFVSLLLSLGYSLLYQPVHIPGRTDQAFLPLFVMLLALGVEGLRPRFLEGVVVLVGMVGSLTILQIYHDNPAKNDSRNYLWELQQNLNPGDVVITTGLTWAETAYYFERWDVPATVLPFPKSVENHPGYLNYREMMRNPGQLYEDAESLVEVSKELLGPDNAIFLLYLRPLNVNGIIAERLIREFPIVIEVGSQPFRQSVLGHGVRIIRMQADQQSPRSYQ